MECQFIVESLIERSHDRCDQIHFNLEQASVQNTQIMDCVARLQDLLRRLQIES